MLFLSIVCMFMGIKYDHGHQIQPNCTTRCTCRLGNFYCESQPCAIDGATCYAAGDPHYYTFDSRYYDFQGDCEYVFSQPCNSSDFSVIVSNSAHNSHVSCTDTVRVVVPGENLDILLGRGGGGTVTINDIPQANSGDEVILTSGGVEVVRVGGHPHVILTELGVRVSWDGLYRVEVTVSTSWRGRLCGLCGNYNGDPDDDFMTPDGLIELSSHMFAVSWLQNSSNVSVSCGGLLSVDACPMNIMEEAQSRCTELSDDIFLSCNNKTNPAKFISDCIFDYCYCNEVDRMSCYCNSLTTYASVCADNGIVLPIWRHSQCCKFIFNL